MKNLVLVLLLLSLGFLLKAQNYGDIVKIKHVLTNTHLHSHAINYGHPNSSGQQQVTAFGGADDNDYWVIKAGHGMNSRSGSINHGDVIRLEHYLTRRNLHSHAGIPSPVSGQQEVTCFGDNGNGDSNDNWRIEIEGGGAWSSNQRVRLIHVNTNHALHSHAGWSHPDWTAGQQEVTGFGGRDDNDWWLLTEVKINRISFPTKIVLPKADPSTTIKIEDIDEWLCPKDLLRGDREFDGHGPRIKCEVSLSIGDDGKALYADIYLWAQETTHDWSTTERRWRKKVYDAPYGKTITAINSDRASRTQFISPPGGFQFLVPGSDVAATVNGFLDGAGGSITNAVLASFGIPPGDFRKAASLITGYINSGNTVVRVPAIEGTLVRFFNIVGDTGSADISTDDNCNDDTRIVKLEFNPVTVTMR
ncbi:MAG: hypothetical protein KIPDCIKN_03553 [Haliscomenobacter sp.]|jgi:hypothetical protein|nr:hypothetical protein [Haliscomenobacter sp.]